MIKSFIQKLFVFLLFFSINISSFAESKSEKNILTSKAQGTDYQKNSANGGSSKLKLNEHQYTFTKKDDYNYVQTQNFHIYSSINKSNTRKIIRYLETFASKADEIFKTDTAKKIKPSIYILEDRREFFLFCKKNKIDDVKYGGGYFDALHNEIVTFFTEEVETTISILFHEITHFYIRSYFHEIPQAINEGLSGYLETCEFKFGNPEFNLVNLPYQKELQLMVKNNSFLPIEKLLSISGYNLGAVNETFGVEKYSQSWYLVWYCLNDKALKPLFSEYIEFIRNNNDSKGEHFIDIVVKPSFDFSQKWISYIPKLTDRKNSKTSKNVSF